MVFAQLSSCNLSMELGFAAKDHGCMHYRDAAESTKKLGGRAWLTKTQALVYPVTHDPMQKKKSLLNKIWVESR